MREGGGTQPWRCSIRFPARSFVLLLLCSIVGAAGAAGPRGDGELDRVGRTIKDADSERVNFLLAVEGVALDGKGNAGARSVVYQEQPRGDDGPSLRSGTRPIAAASSVYAEAPAPALTSVGPGYSVAEEWRAGVLGSAIGRAGLVVADIDGAGGKEIVAGGSSSTFGANTYWYVLRYDPASGKYFMVWVSDFESDTITALSVFDVNGDGVSEIFVGLGDGTVKVFSGATMQEVGSFGAFSNPIKRIVFGDADNDSDPEIVVTDGAETSLFDRGTYALQHTIGDGAVDLAVGNVDTDADLEIVFADGVVLQLNGTTETPEWTYASDFGVRVQLANIDADAQLEIIAASSWYYITSFDADLQSPKWQINTSQDIDAFLMVDITDDGVAEVIYGDGQWGSVHCLDAVTFAQLCNIAKSEHGVSQIAVADTDGDSGLEIVFGAGYSSTGQDLMHVHDVATGTEEWASVHIDPPFYSTAIGDVDGDGTQDIVVASAESESGYSDGIVKAFSGRSHEVLWQTARDTFGRQAWTGVHAVAVGDVDDDGQTEVVVGTDKLYTGAIYVLDGETGAVENSYFYDSGAPIISLAVFDVDSDGDMEIVAGGSREHTGAPGIYVYVIDGASGVVEWNSVNLGTSWDGVIALRIGNIDSDAAQEIVAVADYLYIIDGISHVQWQSATSDYESVWLLNALGDARLEVVAGRDNGTIEIIDGETKVVADDFQPTSDSIKAVAGRVDSGSGKVDIFFAGDSTLGLYDLQSDAVAWESSILGGQGLAGPRAIAVGDVDPDAATEVVVGSDYAVFQFQYCYPNTDTDGDGVPDCYDVCPSTPDVDQLDFDIDFVGDACDLDDDNDGVSDASENTHGSDAKDPNSYPLPFADITDLSHPAYFDSLALLDAGIAAGCDAGPTFCADQIVPREAAALWLLKAVEGGAYTPPGFVQKFDDVPSGSFADAWISDMHADYHGYSTGCDEFGNEYCPKEGLSKAQAAQMILRAKVYGSEPACTEAVWNDVNASTPGCGWIEEMGRMGYSEGCGSGNFCPDELLTFGGFGKLIVKAFGLTP